MTRLAILAATLALAAGCSSSHDLVSCCAADGSPVPLVYRHEVRAADAGSRAPVAGALVGVRSGEDPVWQVDWTDGAGAARLSEEYADAKVVNDRRSVLFFETENAIRLAPPAFQLAARHPAYRAFDGGYGGAEARLEGPRDGGGPVPFAVAEAAEPRLCALEPAQGQGPAAATSTAAGRLALGDLAAMASEARTSLPRAAGAASPVHGGRFWRATGATGKVERAAKVYVQGGRCVLVAPWLPQPPSPTASEDDEPEAPGAKPDQVATEGGASIRRIAALCDSADLVLHSGDKLPIGEAPSPRWVLADREVAAARENRVAVAVAALDAGLAAGAKRVALFYPLDLAPLLDRQLRKRGFQPFAEWWTTFD